ncbi:hypothetical protein [Vibrio barjaei]|uniref:hypothetical protein n=1 Tax=Vibrio barjaei TaxID=1676683 RepID=UPI0022833694|nr:hypothetical protein [Vibrio barjaei]MCY9874017.1 hypothetical protein [Vibrio barjaei]
MTMESLGQNNIDMNNINNQCSSTIQTIRNKQNEAITHKARNLGFMGFTLVGFFLLGMVALQIISGVIALIVAFGSIALMFYAFHYIKANDRRFRMMMRNRAVEKMIEEAREHKIATLSNMVIDSNNRLMKAREARNKLGGYVKTLQDRLKTSNPESSSYERKVTMAKSVEDAYKIVKQNVDTAAEAHKTLEVEVQDFKEMDEFTGIVTDAMKLAQANSDPLEHMLGMEAFNAINNDFNQAMANIENSVSDFEIDNA